MPVLTLAEYATLESNVVDLKTDEIWSFKFSPPDGFVLGKKFAQPVLFFTAQPNGATKVVVRVGEAVNGRLLKPGDFVCEHTIGTGDNDDEQWRTLHCIVHGSKFENNGPTDIHILPVFGRLKLSEVVLLFQFKFDTAAK